MKTFGILNENNLSFGIENLRFLFGISEISMNLLFGIENRNLLFGSDRWTFSENHRDRESKFFVRDRESPLLVRDLKASTFGIIFQLLNVFIK